MENTKKVISSTTKVRFQDSDPFNHLNNGKYIDYMMNAREDQIEAHYGLNLFDLAQKQGIGWVVASNQISYINSALVMEDLYMESQLMGFSPKHIHVEIRMWNKDRTQLKAFLWAKFVHFNLKTKQVHHHNEELTALFTEAAYPVAEQSFEERNKFWRVNAIQQEVVFA